MSHVVSLVAVFFAHSLRNDHVSVGLSGSLTLIGSLVTLYIDSYDTTN